MIRIIDLAKGFTLDALSEATPHHLSGLGADTIKHRLVHPSSWFLHTLSCENIGVGGEGDCLNVHQAVLI